MELQCNIDKIFAELEQHVRREMQLDEERKKQEKDAHLKEESNPSIESPKDAPKTQEVAPATSKTTEDKHGGDEASKEIKDSPNAADGGESATEKNSEDKKQDNEGNEDEIDSKEENEEKDNNSEGVQAHNSSGGHNPSKYHYASKDYVAEIDGIFDEKQKTLDELRKNNKEEFLIKYIMKIIKKIAASHAGIDKQDGSESYDKTQMLLHMTKMQNYKLLGDKYDLKDARYVQFFIDTSGVYGCGSNKVLHELIPKVISLLERQGYECILASCGNGFHTVDKVDEPEYNTRKKLEAFKAGKVSKIVAPCPATAARMANEAEFSVILADFDGLTSICEMANLCSKDKLPYFLCTEDRYPWEDPTLHDWVTPELCHEYNPELVYDVSLDGNPTLEQFYDRQYEDEYVQDDSQEYGYDE